MKSMTPCYMRLLRLFAGLSLDELGQRIGVSASYLSRVERGYARLSSGRDRAWAAALAHVRLPATPLLEEDSEAQLPEGPA